MSCFRCFSSPGRHSVDSGFRYATSDIKVPVTSPSPGENTLPQSVGMATHQLNEALSARECVRAPPVMLDNLPKTPIQGSGTSFSTFNNAEAPSVVLHVLDSRSQLRNTVVQARGLELSLFALDNGGIRVVDAQDFAPLTAKEKKLEAFEESIRTSMQRARVSEDDDGASVSEPVNPTTPESLSSESLYLRVIHTSPTLLTSLEVPSIRNYAEILSEAALEAALVDHGLLSSLIDGAAFAALRGRTRTHKYCFPTLLVQQDGYASAFQGMTIQIESGMWSGGLPVVILRHLLPIENEAPVAKLDQPGASVAYAELSLRPMKKTDSEIKTDPPVLIGSMRRNEAGLHSETAIASHIAFELPALLTLITMDGEVLYQNECSKEFYGNLTGRIRRPRASTVSLLDSNELGFWTDSLGRLLAAPPQEANTSSNAEALITDKLLEPQPVPQAIQASWLVLFFLPDISDNLHDL